MKTGNDLLYSTYRRGINLGGWLSQFEIDAEGGLSPEDRRTHFETFISAADLRRISGWGFDHVRLPVDGRVLVGPEPGSALDAEVMAAVDRCVEWCARLGLGVVLDLHDFHGNEWGQMSRPVDLIAQERLRDHFCATWRALAEHFAGRADPPVMFELLNEVSDATGHLWNSLYQRAIREIRAIDPERWILVGSNGQNAVSHLNDLVLPDDPLVFFTFHYYEPQAFTHQRAHFSPEHREFGQQLSYPGDLTGFREYLATRPEYREKHRPAADEERNDKDLMERLLAEAASFAARTGRGVYCGEYGVIDSAEPADAARWLSDFEEWADRSRIGRALWTYKDRDFGLLRGDEVRSALLLEALGLRT